MIAFSTEEFRDENQNPVDSKVQLAGSIDVQTQKVRKVAVVRATLNTLAARIAVNGFAENARIEVGGSSRRGRADS